MVKAHCPFVPSLRLSAPQHTHLVQLRGVAVEVEAMGASEDWSPDPPFCCGLPGHPPSPSLHSLSLEGGGALFRKVEAQGRPGGWGCEAERWAVWSLWGQASWVQTQLYHLLPVWPWRSSLISLCLSFLTCHLRGLSSKPDPPGTALVLHRRWLKEPSVQR